MSWSNWIYLPGSYVFKRRLQDVLKISSRHLARMSSRHLFKIFWRHFQDIFKMSCQDVFKTYSRRLWDTFKMYHEVKLFFLARVQNVFKTYLARVWDALRRKLSIEMFAYVVILRNSWLGYKFFKSHRNIEIPICRHRNFCFYK